MNDQTAVCVSTPESIMKMDAYLRSRIPSISSLRCRRDRLREKFQRVIEEVMETVVTPEGSRRITSRNEAFSAGLNIYTQLQRWAEQDLLSEHYFTVLVDDLQVVSDRIFRVIPRLPLTVWEHFPYSFKVVGGSDSES